MERTITTNFDNYEAHFKFQENTLHISLKSFKKMSLLFAHYSADNLPSTLYNVIDSPF